MEQGGGPEAVALQLEVGAAHGLPPAAFVRLLGRTVASLQLVDAQVRSEVNVSCHAAILQVPSKRWYNTPHEPAAHVSHTPIKPRQCANELWENNIAL
jgi:hypothetical protein